MDKLPGAAICLILSHLEVEDIAKCSCVSKAWAFAAHSGNITQKVRSCESKPFFTGWISSVDSCDL